ncbi:MAG: twin-arginine translocase TatA/TatE family subunit [Breznakibacter sp.]
MSGGEIIVIFLVMLLLFGSKKLPDLARTLGKGMREFQKAKDEIQNELSRSTADVRNDLSSAAQSFQSEVDELKRNLTSEANDLVKGVKTSDADLAGLSEAKAGKLDGEVSSQESKEHA